MSALFDWLLALSALALGLASVAARSRFAAIALFIAYGVLVSLLWVRMGAVDVALAEAAIGAGLTGVLMLQAAPGASAGPAPRLRALPVAVAAATAAALMVAVADIGRAPGETLGARAMAELGRAGADNPVTAVLLSYRGWDTFLETVVLGVALVAVWALAAEAQWGGPATARQRVRPAGLLSTFGRLLPPVGLVTGAYLVWTGASAPGGAFQGGTVLAAMWLLAMMADRVAAPATGSAAIRLLLVAGPALFLAAGLLGTAFGTMFGWPPGFEKPAVLAVEFGLAVSIAATLALLVVGPPQLGR